MFKQLQEFIPMNNTLLINRNLTVHEGSKFNGNPLLPNNDYIEEYLWSIDDVIKNALCQYPRVMVIRFDLHLPSKINCIDIPDEFDSTVISKFFDSLKAKIDANINHRLTQGKRVHPCKLRYVWVKEICSANQPHYHVAIFLNNDTYNSLGNYNVNDGSNTYSRIIEAWASALGRECYQVNNLVHFPMNRPIYYLDRYSLEFEDTYEQLFKRLSYFAKIQTKSYGHGSKLFSCSRR